MECPSTEIIGSLSLIACDIRRTRSYRWKIFLRDVTFVPEISAINERRAELKSIEKQILLVDSAVTQMLTMIASYSILHVRSWRFRWKKSVRLGTISRQRASLVKGRTRRSQASKWMIRYFCYQDGISRTSSNKKDMFWKQVKYKVIQW